MVFSIDQLVEEALVISFTMVVGRRRDETFGLRP
jgi:hypothetical protein